MPTQFEKTPLERSSSEHDGRFEPAGWPQQRLGIVHLLLWVTASAICLEAEEFWLNGSGPAAEPTATIIAVRSAEATVEGAALGGVLLLIYRGRRGRSFAREPGEWLLCGRGLYVAAWIAIEILSGTVSRLMPKSDIVQTGNLVRYGDVAAEAIEPVLFALVAARLNSAVWRATFWLLAVLHLPLPILSAARVWLRAHDIRPAFLYCYLMLATAILIVAASLLDRRASINRPWTHWAGVAVGVGTGMLAFLP
jgi:hypothetical protein